LKTAFFWDRWTRFVLIRVAVAMAFTLIAHSGAKAAYVQVYSTIQKGAITFTGNTLELNGNAVANSGTPGTSATGGAFIAVDLPASRYGTFPFGTIGPTAQFINNSSRAVLNVPAGATVLYAELIWSGTMGTLTALQMNSTVKFTTPSGSYTITPSAVTAGNSGTFYTRSANVTGLVQIGGAGTYTTGGVPGIIATSGTTDAAGWTLAVAYADPAQVARNLTIFVGAEQAGAAAASVSGFCTPTSGLVNGRLLVSGIEGDSSGVGDTMLFGPTSVLGAGNRLFGPNNLIGNFFASQINGDLGNLDTSGTFGTLNNPQGGNTIGARQGYDITNVDATAQLANSQTTAFAQGTTTGDSYAINALGLQINVSSPVFPVSSKSVNKTFTFVGDTLHYAVNLDNTAGNGTANAVSFFDTLPAGMSLVTNSVTVNGTLQAGADPAVGVNVGNIPVGALVTVGFDVRVNALPASPAAAKFDNAARWTYTYIACAGTVAQAGTVTTGVVSTPAARLEPVKTVSPVGALVGGQTATYTIAIPNTGLLDTAGTTLADPIPSGTTYVAGSTKLNGVAVADASGGLMPFATAALVNSAGKAAGVIAFGSSATVQFSVVAAGSGTVLNVATIDPDGVGPGTALTVSAVNSILVGPSVTKVFAPTTIGAGGTATITVTLSNPNAQIVLGAAVTDNLPSGMVIASPANASTTCASGVVTAAPTGTTLALSNASIPASGSCTLRADVTVSAAGSYINNIPAGAVSSSNAGVNTAGSGVLTVTPAPSVSKSFTPGTVAAGASATLTITLSNPTAAALTAVGFSDLFPSTAAGAPGNMTLFDAVTSNTCGGVLTDAAGAALVVGSSSLKLVGGSIPATNVCTITAHVKAPTGGAYGNTIPVGAMSTSGGANTAAAAATLQIASPQVQKSFALNTVAANTPTTMTITITNVTGATITGLAFTDTYPTGLVNSAAPTVTNTCGGTATASSAATNPGTFTLSGATSLLAGSSCTLTVNVQSATSGSYTNTIAAGAVASSIGSNAVATSDTLNIARPDIAKAFSVPTIPVGNTATLTITLSNPTAVAMTAAAFTDTLPAGLTSSAPLGTCAGTKAASGSTVTLTGGTIPANSSCTVIATVTGTSIGLKNNTIPAGGLTVAGPASNGTSADASITVLARPTISKTFLTSTILPASGSSALQITLSNSNPTALTSAAFTDTFPTAPGAMTVFDLVTSNTCSGSLLNNLGGALVVGSAGIQLSGGTIPSNGSCVITVNVKAAVAGDYTNTIAASPTSGSLSTANGGGNSTAATAPLAVRLTAPLLSKAFAPTTIVANSATTLTLTITNPSTTTAITGAALSDIFPAGMKVFGTPAFSNTCGGTVGSGNVANDTSLALTGGTVPFNPGGTGSCSISVQVTSSVVAASPGVTNTTGAVTSINANTSSTAAANLIVNAPPLTAPTIVKSFSPANIGAGGISTMTFMLGSGNASILNNGNFTDTLVNMTVASTVIGGGCVGVTSSPALVVGATSLNLTVPNVAPGGCSVTVQVTSSTLGANPNTVSGVTTTQVPTAGAGSGPVNLTVILKPTVSKAFSPAIIGVGKASVLTLTLNNPSAIALTGVNLTDTYPANLSNGSTPAGSTTCNGGSVTAAANGGAVALSGASLAAGASCTVSVSVTSALTGAYANTSGGVSSNETGAAGNASNTANLTVVGTALAKAFSPTSIAPNGVAVLSFTVNNGAGNPAQDGFGFTDTLQAGLTISGTPAASQCGGSVTSTANSVTLSSASLALGAASCTVNVNVTSASQGSYTNTSANLSGVFGGLDASTASASLAVQLTPSVVKSFAPNSIAPGAKSTLTFLLNNPALIALTGVAFNDVFPASAPSGGALTVASPLNVSSTCGGSLTDNSGAALAAGASGIKLSGGGIAATSTCTITVEVTASRAGSSITSYTNSIAAGGLTTSNGGNSAAATSAVLSLPLPLISKVFSPNPVGRDKPSVLTITLSNLSANAYSGAAFTDTYPSGLVNTGSASGATTCAGGVVTAANNGNSVALAGATVPAFGSCTVTVNVKSPTQAGYTNTIAIGGLTTSAGTNDIAASDVLDVGSPDLQVTKTHVGNFVVGSTANFSLQVNNFGGVKSSAGSYTVTDTLPAGLTLVSASGSGWVCSNNLPTTPTTVTCTSATTISGLAANPNLVTLTVNVLPSAFPSVGNTATVAGGNDVDPTNNSVTDTALVLGPPQVTKAFSPSAITADSPTVLSITLTNPNASVAITGAAFTDAYPSGLVNTAAPAVSTTCPGGTTTAFAGGNSLSLSGASVPANGSCVVTVNVTSSTPSTYLNSTGPVSTTNVGTGASDSATLTVGIAGVNVSGVVYSDTNHSATLDLSEAGTGLTLYAKLIAANASTAAQAVLVNPVTGAYSFSPVIPGNYSIVIDDNNTLTDVTPTWPNTWTGTEMANFTRSNVQVAAIDVSNQNFGAFNGNVVSGRVFKDNGAGGGTPNNALQDGAEVGIAGVAVRLTNAAGNTTLDSTSTDASGYYRLWIPAAQSGTTLRVVETNLGGTRSVGGSPALSYDRPTDAFSFSYVAGSDTTNLNFADVATETLNIGQNRNAAPGDSVFYAHSFMPGTGGSVLFSFSNNAPAWPQTLLRDVNCNGVIDAGDTVISAAVSTTAGTPVCVIVKLLVPAGTALGTQNLSSLQAVFSYSNASPALSVTLTNDDVTTLGGSGAGLLLVKTQDNATPLPGGRINYTLTFTNQGSQAITSLRLSDASPAYTRFVSAACLPPLAAGLSLCTVTTNPSVGGTGPVEWTLTGSLLPSASGQVTFAVDVGP
jgi:uncharacterized repeat protein (TIGR01451 family)